MKNWGTFQEQVKQYSEGTLVYGDFLDFMYSLSGAEMVKHFAEELRGCELEDEKVSYIVASIEYIMLSKDLKEEIPMWIKDVRYILRKPYFACKKGSPLMIVLQAESPFSFIQRNIFVSENAVDRVQEVPWPKTTHKYLKVLNERLKEKNLSGRIYIYGVVL